MKYIRTKDGIYGTNYHDDKEGYYITTDYDDFKDNEVKVANTIEELCDRYVANMKNNVPIIYPLESKYQLNKLLNEKKEIAIVYGAIWTDKGLIYVAKMNEKGCLELI